MTRLCFLPLLTNAHLALKTSFGATSCAVAIRGMGRGIEVPSIPALDRSQISQSGCFTSFL